MRTKCQALPPGSSSNGVRSTETNHYPSVERRIRTWLTRNQIPTALVAVFDDWVIGTVALKDRELRDLEYGPGLAGLFVVPQHRRRGVGALLVAAAERQASALGVRDLHLYTPASEGFYERLGWTVIDQVALPSGTVSVMRKRVEGPNSTLLTDALHSALRAAPGAAKRER